ncbi:hypothetical protein VO54_01508 [Elizabethkingia miricola]|nr:hypothetical protein VO54_01508 [Elizabethkingia miricola]
MKIMIKNRKKYGSFVVLSALFLSVTSCRSNTDSIGSEMRGEGLVYINFKDTEFDDPTEGKQASAKLGSPLGTNQEQTIKLSNNLYVTATLTPISNKSSKVESLEQNLGSFSASISPLTTGVKYRVVVFDNNGNYVTQKDYSVGEENNNPIKGLNGGSTYKFVIYSFGSTAAIQNLSSSNTSISSYSASIPSGGDCMYQNVDLTVTGETKNYLDVHLKHLSSQVTLNIDAAATGYSIYSAKAQTDDLGGNYIFNLGSSLVIGGSTDKIPIQFTFQAPDINNKAQSLSSSPLVILYNEVAKGKDNVALPINIKLILKNDATLGGSGDTNYTLISQNLDYSKFTITKGTRYNLNLKLTVKDAILSNYYGYKAVRINGQVWMDDVLRDSNGNINFYQHGSKSAVATSKTAPGPISGWTQVSNEGFPWSNGGTGQGNTRKSPNDPCPNGWRIPQYWEYRTLLGNSTITNSTNPSKITSKRDPNVFFNAVDSSIGYRSATDGSLVNTPVSITWLDAVLAVGSPYSNVFSPTTANYDYSMNRSAALPVRCIADSYTQNIN